MIAEEEMEQLKAAIAEAIRAEFAKLKAEIMRTVKVDIMSAASRAAANITKAGWS